MRQLPSNALSSPQDFCHELSLISEEIDFLGKIMIQGILNLRHENPNEYVSIEIQTCNKLSKDYIDIAVRSNDVLSVTVATGRLTS